MPAHFALRPARSLETPMTRRRRRGAGVAAILLAACAATTDARAQTPNLPYGPAPYQLFDWYPPIQIGGVPTQNAPWVVYVHGSGASKTDVADVGQLPLADLYRWNGFAVFAFNWANFASAVYPVQLQDATRATQHLRANAATYGIDPDRMVLWGHSAGGTIGGWLAFGEDQQQPQGTAEAQQSTRPQAFVNWRGLMNFQAMKPSFPGTGFGATTLGQLPFAFLGQVSPALMIGSVNRAFTPPTLSYYTDVFSLPPIGNPHDAWFMTNLHQQLSIHANAAAKLSTTVQNPDFPAVKPELMEDMAQWSMVRVGLSGPLNLGHASKGKTGFPLLGLHGDLGAGGTATLTFQAARKESTTLYLALGVLRKDLPFLDVTLVTKPLLLVPLPTDATGALSLDVKIPPGAEGRLYLQFLHADASAPLGVAASNGLRVEYGG